MKLIFRQDLNIATIKSESSWNRMVVHSLLQNCNAKQPAINAYLGARYSRSSDSILDIASEVINTGTDASERLEKIFAGYGHKSVGDMAELFVCIENIPIITGMKFFYINPVIAGQERSTRYQDFSDPNFIKIPNEVCSKQEIRKEYEKIIFKQLSDYKKLLKSTKEQLSKHFKINEESSQECASLKARSFDVARYLLPVGLSTSDALVLSARAWSDFIGYLFGGDSIVDNEVADLVLNLLGESDLDARGYIREADNLIRHTESNSSRRNSTREILDYLKKNLDRKQIPTFPDSESSSIKVSYSPDLTECLLTHYEALLNPLGSIKEYSFDQEDQEFIGEVLSEHHNQHRTVGNVAQSGAVKIEGFATLGTLKDLNRHRSLERFIPILHDEIDMDQELARREEDCFFLCNYLDIPQLKILKEEYQEVLEETYSMIKSWREKAKKVLSEEVCNEYTKYLLPHAHATKYIMYGSYDDLQYVINLRSRNGGHIAYRVLVYEWLRNLNMKDPIWNSLLKRIQSPKIDSKIEFVDRS